MSDREHIKNGDVSRKYANEEWLRKKLITEGLSIEEIADMCNTDEINIHTNLISCGVIESKRHAYNLDGKFNNKSWLKQKYEEENMSMRQIANECDISVTAIRQRLYHYNIKIKNDKHSNRINGKINDAEWLHKQLHKKGNSVANVADMCSTTSQTVYDRLREFGIPTPTEASGQYGEHVNRSEDFERETKVSDEELRDIFE